MNEPNESTVFDRSVFGRHPVQCFKCKGTGDTPWGRCRRCGGEGGIMPPYLMAPRAVQYPDRYEELTHQKKLEEAAEHASWTATHDDVVGWIHANAHDNDFAQSLIKQLDERGSLTAKQCEVVRWNWVRRKA